MLSSSTLLTVVHSGYTCPHPSILLLTQLLSLEEYWNSKAQKHGMSSRVHQTLSIDTQCGTGRTFWSHITESLEADLGPLGPGFPRGSAAPLSEDLVDLILHQSFIRSREQGS